MCADYNMKRPELFRFLLRVAERHAAGSPLALPEMRAETAAEYAARRLPDGPYTPEDLKALAAIELGFIGKAPNQPLSRAHVDAWCEQREISTRRRVSRSSGLPYAAGYRANSGAASPPVVAMLPDSASERSLAIAPFASSECSQQAAIECRLVLARQHPQDGDGVLDLQRKRAAPLAAAYVCSSKRRRVASDKGPQARRS